MIVSEFYDLDVGTVKKIEIKPRRVQDSFLGTNTWILNEVGNNNNNNNTLFTLVLTLSHINMYNYEKLKRSTNIEPGG